MLCPLASFAKGPNCYSWPMNMTLAWMKNENIVDIRKLDESKTKITQLVSEEIKKGCIRKYITLFFMIHMVIATKLLPKAKHHMKNVQSVM
jgi:hypothetical protein